MKACSLCFLLFFYVFLRLTKSAESNAGKLGDAIKNHTRSVVNSTKTQQNEEENLLKQETHKLLLECGGDTANSNYDSNGYNSQRGSNRNGNGNNYDNFSGSNRRKHSNSRYNNNEKSNNRYGNRDNRYSNYGYSTDDNDSNDSDRNNRYDNKRNGGNGRNGNNENCSDEENSNESNQSGYNKNARPRRFNRTSSSNNRNYNGGYNSRFNKNNYNGNTGNNEYNNDCREDTRGTSDGNSRNQWKPYADSEDNYGYDNRNYGLSSYGNNGNMRRGVTSSPGYGRDFRTKRSNNEEDSQCISQCIFGYLEVLDDNRVPSETLMIKWLQDRLTNDMKRIRALREARRCFARLSTSDVEDGCEFSKSLSKCLNLELE